ncbi:flagellar assembly protein FliX [Phenylobacterium sp.]|uniref:flagellar assembly regulator FliX n=1 Tax=Phenylobacterium sp. TaxID=1871053 RepID=UPI002BACAA51|nr:flagellar assembly protein FliX [Phenylobacterium sp.]HVI33109.1 flagellar assembly protein FliX [Phenylobacterium sp.]
MKVTGPGAIGPAGGPKAKPSGGSGFRLPGVGQAEGPAPSAGVSATSSIMGMDALLALQDVGGPLERKRRAVSRAGRILDVLDDMKVALLDGRLSGHDLDRLRRAVRDERAQTDDPKLEAVLEEIEVRAAVEMAKLEQAQRAA